VGGWLARLGADLSFARAVFWARELTGIAVSAATMRRHTEALGATAVAQADANVAPTCPCPHVGHDAFSPPLAALRRSLARKKLTHTRAAANVILICGACGVLS